MNEEALKRIRNGQYKDRGTVKWRAFASMPEQYIGLTKVLEDKLKVEQPLLSADQIEQINQILSEAIHNQKEVYLTYYKQGHCITEIRRIEHINVHKKCIYFIDDVFELRNEIPLTALIGLRFK
ncbi:YolD-like family protein [Priestia megaterium]|uniref:YolD-like family protein n=1 Tax=Priestia megaterium TaxID=1404 RepID=UPI002731C8BC|nr:YolD-like family protein [Priestia megaterium]MDP1471886.1 YolD-like family protein [Priestia megaterium]